MTPILEFAIKCFADNFQFNEQINEPSIKGTIKEVNENSILVENESGEYWVSLTVENKDGIYSPIMAGDKVTVYHDGNIAENYPMQINTVHAILLVEPADRTVNEKS